MSRPEVPIPGNSSRQSGGNGMGRRSPSFTAPSSGPATASPVPLVIAAVSVILGALDLLFLDGDSLGTVFVGLVGYLLSGFVPLVMLGWDVTSQRRGVKNPNFRPRRGFTVWLRVLVGVGFVVAVVHLVSVADSLALVISEWLFVTGWVTP